MSDKKQPDAEQHEEHSKICKVWLRIKRWWLPIAILLITSIGLVCALSIPQKVFQTPSNLNDRDTSTSQNLGTPDNKETSHTIQSPSNSDNRNAPVLLAQSNLRLAFLYITGGAIAVMGLIETFRKNNNEKLKNDQEKEKNDRDHLRQVRAERRERYTKAVEQLGDEKAPIRMGGVYTLVGLIDEWLKDEFIDKYEERLKEGQVIINNLCAYIRSPFTLTTRYDELSEDSPTSDGVYKDNQQEFYTDKAEFKAETDVRRSIIKEIHDRLQGPEENTPGTWSDFEYDFSGSTFFYPVDLINSYYKKSVNFCGSRYYKEVNFSGSTYEKDIIFSTSDRHSTYQDVADFHESTYQGGADFSDSTYEGEAIFRDSTYQDVADFHESTYKGEAYFSRSTYKGEAYFSLSTYKGRADFAGSTYHGRVDFAGSTYQYVIFSTTSIFSTRQSIYQDMVIFSGSTYESNAIFIGSTYAKDVTFNTSDYQKAVNFNNSIYYGQANFSGSTYKGDADFSRSISYQGTYFCEDGDINSFSRFTDFTPQFYKEKSRQNTLFGSTNNDFMVDNDKGYPINLNSEGLPLGCKFLTSEQKEYIEDKIQEIEKTNNKLLEVKDPKEKAELSKNLQALTEELHEWREEVTTVEVEDGAIENMES